MSTERGEGTRKFSYRQKELALERQGYCCPVCGKAIGTEGQGHHMCQYWQGGATHEDNLMVVHKGRCHEYLDAQATLFGNIYTIGHLADAEPSQIADYDKYNQALHKIEKNNNSLTKRMRNVERVNYMATRVVSGRDTLVFHQEKSGLRFEQLANR